MLATRRQIRDFDPYALTRYAEEGRTPAQSFATARFGTEAAARFIDPVVRAFAGTGLEHTTALSVLGALAVGDHRLINVLGGMAALPFALAARLDTRCGIDVTRVSEDASGVTVQAVGHEFRADACLLSVMYADAQRIWPALEPVDPAFASTLRPVPLISISLGYEVRARTSAYTVLIPTVEQPDALLAFMQQHKAPDRVSPGHSLVTMFTEARATGRYLRETDEDIVAWADRLITRWYPELEGARDLGVVSRWQNTGYLPTPGFWERVRDQRSRLPNHRIFVTSTLFGSGSIERAVLGGERAAERLLPMLGDVTLATSRKDPA
jgi:protoporphyrinogen/coproporphyrinogen III oxidase